MGENNQAKPLNPDECREPTTQDVANLCLSLNQAQAQYLVVGGFAIRAAGYLRATMDVDLLIATGMENETRVIQALMSLPDKAVSQIQPGEVEQYGVVRIADEILVDLMKSACGVSYADASADIVFHEVEGVRVPFASPRMLWRMKQTHREKDIADRFFLKRLLEPPDKT
jgi:hypothetical protein